VQTLDQQVLRLVQGLQGNLMSVTHDSAHYQMTKLGERALAPLLELLQQEEPDNPDGLAMALGIVGPSVVEPLLQTLRSPAPKVRSISAKVLGYVYAGFKNPLTDTRPVDALLLALEDSEPSVRSNSAFSLSILGRISETGRVFHPLLQMLQKAFLADEADVIRSAVVALGSLGDRRAVETLCQALHYDSPHIRGRAARSLGEIGDPSAVPDLIQAMQETRPEYWGTVCAAASTLGSLQDTRAVPALIKMTRKKGRIAGSAQAALDSIGDSHTLPRKVVAEERLSVEERALTLEAMSRLGPIRNLVAVYPIWNVAKYCTSLLEDEDWGVRTGAQKILTYCTSVRPSQAGKDQNSTLLRAMMPSETTLSGERLLRATEAPPMAADPPPKKPNLLLRFFRRTY
jgi:HEAT repeat protein